MGFHVSNKEQAKALGLEHLWPDKWPENPLQPVVNPLQTKIPRRIDGMNKLETAFWQRLQEARFARVYREPFRLRLAGRTHYTPDFVSAQIIERDVTPALTCWEVKGFMRDDAAVKLKVAAELYPWMRFVLVTRPRKLWCCRDVTDSGIGRAIWTPEWLR